MVRYLDPPPSLFFGPPAELVRVRSVSPDQLQLRQLLLQLVGQEPLRAVAVVQAGGVNASAEYQPTGVHEQVALPARESLGPVVAAFWAADTGGSHDLAVQDRPARIAGIRTARDGSLHTTRRSCRLPFAKQFLRLLTKLRYG